MINLMLGNCLDKLKELESNSIDSIVTDPPYGLSFMGKKWDYDVPSVEIWKEALRVLKPGGHLLSFGGTRTYHRMVVNIEDAGFEIRDCIQWLYGSGFPKSHNIKEGDFKGWGTALKPANEPIVVARKPIDGTVAQNVAKYGTGAINIDGSRIGTESLTYKMVSSMGPTGTFSGQGATRANGGLVERGKKTVQGRWPANIILDEEAAQALDEQSGPCKTGTIKNKPTQDAEKIIKGKKPFVTASHEDNGGGASRFFYIAKASKSERNAGLEGMPLKSQGAYGEFAGDGRGRQTEHQPTANHHPTVKPIKLMQYLINLVTPPKGTVLDPFMGSGTTGVAANNLNRKFIGIELSEEYFQIAKRRINKLQLELSE